MTPDLSTDSAASRKALIRQEALLRRDAMADDERARAAAAVAAHLMGLPELGDVASVVGFWPIRNEIDVLPAMRACHDRGQTVALPVVTPDGLVFRRWRPGDILLRKGFGLSEPDVSAPLIRPCALLVPLAAFDRSGARIGYGKGHYDRAIASLDDTNSVMTIGVAFAIQEVQSIPQEPHDRCLAMIVTEAEIIRVQG